MVKIMMLSILPFMPEEMYHVRKDPWPWSSRMDRHAICTLEDILFKFNQIGSASVDHLTTVFLEFPVSVVERTYLSRLEPS